MTKEYKDIFKYGNKEFEMFGEPLTSYINQSIDTETFIYKNDNSIREYTAKWQIVNNKLYLFNLCGGTNYCNVDLKTLFASEDFVFASWYTGTIRILVGDYKEFSPMRGSFSDKEIFIIIEKGEIISSQLKEKKLSPKITIELERYLNQILIEKIEKLNLIGLIDIFNEQVKDLPEILQNQRYSEKSSSVQRIELKMWNSLNKELLFKYVLQNIHTYFFVINKMNVPLPVSSFLSVLDAIIGADFLYVNKKSLKWLNSEGKQLLKNHNVNFDDFVKIKTSRKTYNNEMYDRNDWLQDASGTNDPEIMNDVFWNLD